MIVITFMAIALLGLAGLGAICDRMDRNDELKHNEYVARCRAFHPARPK